MEKISPIPNILSIAGSDPSGGAGIQADLKTCAAHGCYGMAVITALTAQNTQGVQAVQPIDPDFIKAQLTSVFEDIEVSAVKIGMIADEDSMHVIADILEERRPPIIILDPVMVASSGDSLMSGAALGTLKERLIPLAHLVTPNIPECEKLTRKAVLDMEETAQNARTTLGAQAVLLKGGHMKGAQCIDILATSQGQIAYAAPRIKTQNTHGTGCTLSTALACNLAKGMSLDEAVSAAKLYVSAAISSADQLSVGQGGGHGPLNHQGKGCNHRGATDE